MPDELDKRIEQALSSGQLLDAAAKNIRGLLAAAPADLYSRVVEELVAGNEWAELNDRFYKRLEFGTGGLRSRTIVKIVTPAERSTPPLEPRPDVPCCCTPPM